MFKHCVLGSNYYFVKVWGYLSLFNNPLAKRREYSWSLQRKLALTVGEKKLFFMVKPDVLLTHLLTPVSSVLHNLSHIFFGIFQRL